MHWLFSTISFHSTQLERKIKGKSRVLIKDGRLCHKAMQTSHITKQDLESNLRLKCQIDRLEQVKGACLERNGDISFSLKAEFTGDRDN